MHWVVNPPWPRIHWWGSIRGGHDDGSDTQVGFISPHSNNFCGSCNRVRVTAEGKLVLCLGHEGALDLKTLMRRYPGDSERLRQALVDALQLKPEKHEFRTDEQVQVVRFMSMTGG